MTHQWSITSDDQIVFCFVYMLCVIYNKVAHSRTIVQLVFPNLNFIPDLSTCINWANICVDLLTEVSQLFTYYVCRFLILIGSNMILTVASL